MAKSPAVIAASGWQQDNLEVISSIAQTYCQSIALRSPCPLDYIRLTEMNCLMGPTETKVIPYSEDFINSLKETTATSYTLVEVYKEDKLISKYKCK